MEIHKLHVASILLVALALTAIGSSSCTRFSEGSLKLQANPILSGGLGWAVVKDAYVRLKEGPSDSTRDLDHLRRGSVYRLDAREIGSIASGLRDAVMKADERVIWYGIQSESAKGWVRESELDIYGSQAQAERAAVAYR
ncbi:MAG: hypothetical protein ABSF43_05925 [Rectinemataceae bacterium]